ncbi:hypothetical protein PsorP6_007929 [Peronosclerospora sorghi]|uniref:Uncharacterized protein n=1 Tax=Peronosclerospora sorghi TaxID=230839 RepID=A0ACC0W7N6_9STRA|nr:hypothetical protein PsorP6_007929 [Peronosclerospora sorghi]
MTQDGSDLFQIRRIFSFPTSSNGSMPALTIASMVVHTLEKKQLLALAVCEESPKTEVHLTGDSLPTDSANAKTNFLLLRTNEEDQRTRFWRLPVCSTHKQQRSGKAERLTALEFSPEGDWLAALSQRKNRLHLLPVLKLVSNQRRAMLDASYQPTSHHRELMSVHQAAMTIQMASYLRATNEFGGINGARYHSQVAGDDEQMSTLEFAPGIGKITCVRWWRSLNGKNYCLVGGTESLISIVNVEENAEECRCELVNAGTIVSIDLLQENFRKERRTSMLVKTTPNESEEREKKAGATSVWYYRVVLEKKFQLRPKVSLEKEKPSQEDEQANSTSAVKIQSTTGESSSSSETKFTTTVTTGEGVSNVSPKTPTFVIKTFPQHFLEDLDFRPQRIKKNSPHVCLYPINGVLSSESSLALYDNKTRKASLYSNFHWRLKGEYEIPDLLPSSTANTNKDCETKSQEDNTSSAQSETTGFNENDEAVDVDLMYCSTDLMLLQGRTSKSNQTISTWISLPSHQEMEADVIKAHIVHYLTLHGNEKVVSVLQSTAPSRANSHRSGASNFSSSQSNDAEIIYILQTTHHVYECRPQWSRLALFKALCGQTIALRDALSIGYALGIDMASLCQVVAETLYSNVMDRSGTADAQLVRWVRELLEVSRVMPSKALELLVTMGGVDTAIEYAHHVLSKPKQDSVYDGSERRRVALSLVDLVFQQQLQQHTSLCTEEQSEEQEAWLVEFLRTNRDYMTEDIVDLCLSQHHVDKAILVATIRDDVLRVLEKIVQNGLASFVSEQLLRSLLNSGHAAALTCPPSRLILRSFSIETQAEVLLEHPPALLQHRDWLERNLPAISPKLCRAIAAKIDPSLVGTKDAFLASEVEEPLLKVKLHSDVCTSEFIPASREEQIELYLTLLLRLNGDNDCLRGKPTKDSIEEDYAYSQVKLEMLMKDLATQYRPPVMVARCVDYGNWTAAACIYEAHGELVEALECRLQSHNAHSALSVLTSLGRTQNNVEFCQQMREDLLNLLTSLVVESHCSKLISEQVRAAILARILVKWFDYRLDRSVLEEYLLDPDVFTHVSSLLAHIFFSEVVHSVIQTDALGQAFSTSYQTDETFDDRDKEWVHKCQQLAFSGFFLFKICVSFMEKEHDNPDSDLRLQLPLDKLLQLVENNVVENDLSHGRVFIAPHSAQALGKADPLETHVKAFTCGHLFPKRVFEEEVVPEFDKRMNALPMALYTTKQAFSREFKRGACETPCPVCSFNKISQLVFQHYKARDAAQRQEPAARQAKHEVSDEALLLLPVRPRMQQTQHYYFLHRKGSERLGFSAEMHSSKPLLEHEEWEWSEQRLV